MAILAEVNTKFGVKTKMWKIHQTVFDYKTGSVQVTLAGYLSDEEDVEPVIVTQVIHLLKLKAKNDPTREEIYNAVKELMGAIGDETELSYLKPLAIGEQD